MARFVFILMLVLSGAFLAGASVESAGTIEHSRPSETTRTLTVVSEQSGPTVNDHTGPLKVFNSNGSLVDKHTRYDRYWDIDPSPLDEYTLFYTATEGVAPTECDGKACQRNVIGRLNFTTGKHEEVFSRTYSMKGQNEWHDADALNRTHVAVAGIKKDRVFIADTTTDRISWQWYASEHYLGSSGGPKGDWTHLNDIEVIEGDTLIEGGAIMASIRNMDEVVFIEPGDGVQEDLTLGQDGNHSILHEQHNADYIPPERGGPTVIVADSHNNRVAEYQRVNGTWRQTWEWTDARTQWTRDGDRLPNGHTLITDTNGDRVLEVNKSGDIVWSVRTTKAYESERLGTGDESAGGRSMVEIRSFSEDNQSPQPQISSIFLKTWQIFSDGMPPFLLNSVLFILPAWIDPIQSLPLGIAGITLLSWSTSELYWRYSSTVS